MALEAWVGLPFCITPPDGYSVELGRSRLRIDGTEPATTYEISGSSFWGHRRQPTPQP